MTRSTSHRRAKQPITRIGNCYGTFSTPASETGIVERDSAIEPTLAAESFAALELFGSDEEELAKLSQEGKSAKEE